MPLGFALLLLLPATKIICSYWGFGLKMNAVEGRQLELGDAPRRGRFRPFEADAALQGFKAVAGVDEVGRRAACRSGGGGGGEILPRGFAHPEIRDSKMLSAPNSARSWRRSFSSRRSVGPSAVSTSMASIRLNILRAGLTAMAQALHGPVVSAGLCADRTATRESRRRFSLNSVATQFSRCTREPSSRAIKSVYRSPPRQSSPRSRGIK